MKKELILKEYAGQRSDVLITVRDNGSSYITFKSAQGYGYPSLEKDELKELVTKMEALET